MGFVAHSYLPKSVDSILAVRQSLKELDRVPDERTVRYLLGRFGPDNFEALRRANQALLDVKARMEPTREVWLDFNDTVVTLFGHQEGAEVGYNPRYRGRPSHKTAFSLPREGAGLIYRFCG